VTSIAAVPRSRSRVTTGPRFAGVSQFHFNYVYKSRPVCRAYPHERIRSGPTHVGFLVKCGDKPLILKIAWRL
jgi:hypothetical protein